MNGIRSDAYWARLVRALRVRQGLSQQSLADQLGVDQKSVSRWEAGAEPSLRLRRRLRDLMRANRDSRLDRLTRMRVGYAAWPSSLLGEGAVFIEKSASLAGEVGISGLPDLPSLYGCFGEEADEQTAAWERTGIFTGELAMTISLNRIPTPSGLVHFRGLDTPYISSTGDIWCVCEIKRLSAEDYAENARQLGGTLVAIPYDALA
ncbi:MAG: helix-turn-helix transcriptional regulator [Amphiplicatus sp.]